MVGGDGLHSFFWINKDLFDCILSTFPMKFAAQSIFPSIFPTADFYKYFSEGCLCFYLKQKLITPCGSITLPLGSPAVLYECLNYQETSSTTFEKLSSTQTNMSTWGNNKNKRTNTHRSVMLNFLGWTPARDRKRNRWPITQEPATVVMISTMSLKI